MDWPHDPDGEKGSEGGRQYGHAVIAKKLDENEDFPLEAKTFVDDYGEEPIRIDHETVVSVREIFEHLDQSEFSDIVEMHKAVGRAMRNGGYWFYEGADQFSRTR